MKNKFLLFAILHFFITACTKETNSAEEKGVVKGKVVDAAGNPIANAKIVIEHTVLYGRYVYVTTNTSGIYSAQVPQGSWYASAQIEKNYLGRNYTFDLHPDVAEAFSAGAVRNFTWKLSGAKPRGGYYGSNVAVYPEPGSSFMMEDIELTLIPDGPLADGSIGKTITKTLIDIGGGEDGIRDVPIGKYSIRARNKTTGQPLEIRMRNTGNYGAAVSGIFTSGFTGSTGYQIVVQVK